ncbi:CD109 antigen-like isoform X2 [Amphiprion ocellaris]|uniref:CD109 antigen-like isoform X2 n=1 Tax=Amphiprion ocellaris TaxID=80972 RepID=UPI0024110E15|nr:CD109 antigen-like isoform X2 [Amphiprion ocellaris]
MSRSVKLHEAVCPVSGRKVATVSKNMSKIWTLLVCLEVVRFAVPGSAQNSSSPTLFLISGPEVLHAGTWTQLAVTVFADFPGRVTAEVTHGDTKVTQTEDFQGGLTSFITLPPIPGFITQNSLLNLTLRGYREDTLIFTNTTTLCFDLRNVSSVIQTDRSHYEPGNTVKVRIVVIQLDNRPYKGRVDISVWDPSGKAVDRWESTGNLGIVLQEFTLSQMSPLGRWTITTTVNGVTDEKAFIVEHYEHPHFEVLVKMPPQILVGDDITGSVRALYPSGQPVHGTLVVSVIMDDASPFLLTQTKEIYGSTQFSFSEDQLQALHTTSAFSSNNHVTVHIAACVNDSSTGIKVNKTVEVHLMKNMFQLMFHDFPPTLKPGLHFFTNLRISRYDRTPLSASDHIHFAVVEVTQRTSMMNAETTTLTLPVPEDGDVHIQFRLQDQVVMIFIRATFQSSEETLKVYTNYSSPRGSYIQISPISALSAQIGLPFGLNVESTFQPSELHFVVSSQGQVVSAGTSNSLSFSVTPALSWSPEACVTVYCIVSDGEVATDTARIPINHHNYVSLNWSSDRTQPGEEVSLTVTTLESMSRVGIVVLGKGHEDSQEFDMDVKTEQECNLRMLTNARLYKKKQPDGDKNEGDVLMIQKYWRHLMNVTESFLWLDTAVSEKTWTSDKITVPDGVTSLRAYALVMSENLGLGFTPEPQKLIVSKDFSSFLDVPPHLIIGEEIVLQVNIINHLVQDIEVIVLLAQSETFEFVLTDRRGASVINAQKLTLGSHASASALFPIKPLAPGEMEISVDAVSADGSDSLTRRVMVKPAGIEQTFSQTLFLELEPGKYNSSRSVSFYPADVVPGSQRASVVLVGDILALSINNLDSLIQMPIGCGEQNMIRFAPSVYVLQYLDKSTQDNAEIRSRALGSMMDGYKRQLSYQRDDGSFSAFGTSDTAGSTWLTAFVLRSFLQAKPYVQVDQSVVSRAMTWLFKQQGPQGEFREAGRLIHTEMQGGLDNGPVALTAYVLVAVLEDEAYAEIYRDNVSLAQKYLENQVSSGVVSNYSLSLVAYALALRGSTVAGTALTELNSRADYRDGVKMWRSSAGLRSRDWQPRSVQIEMTSYVLLALFRRGSFIEGIKLMKWLSMQRNHLGGYGTTQDTIVALQALACYAAFSGANAIDLRFNISTPASSSLFRINSTNYRAYQSQEINAEKDPHLNIYMEGRGFALFQLNVFYHLESRAFSQNLQQARGEEAFSLDVDVMDDSDHSHMMLSICIRLKDNQVIPHTGMAILDVGMLSGFTLSPGAAVLGNLIRKVEEWPEKVSLYLDSITKSKVCIILPIVTNYKVAHVQDAVVQVYDYYEPSRKATATYNPRFLHSVDSCFFCGANCADCRPGITIIVSSANYSTSSSIYSLSCLFLGLVSFLVVV